MHYLPGSLVTMQGHVRVKIFIRRANCNEQGTATLDVCRVVISHTHTHKHRLQHRLHPQGKQTLETKRLSLPYLSGCSPMCLKSNIPAIYSRLLSCMFVRGSASDQLQSVIWPFHKAFVKENAPEQIQSAIWLFHKGL